MLSTKALVISSILSVVIIMSITFVFQDYQEEQRSINKLMRSRNINLNEYSLRRLKKHYSQINNLAKEPDVHQVKIINGRINKK